MKDTVLYAGIDVHKNSFSIQCMTDHTTQKKFRLTEKLDGQSVLDIVRKRYPDMKLKVAYEAGFSGFTLCKELRALDVEAIVVHPADIPSTDFEKRQKTDASDAKKIALALRSGMLRSIHIPEDQMLKDRGLVRLRGSISKDIRRTKNRIKSRLMFFNLNDPLLKEGKYWPNRFVDELDRRAEKDKDVVIATLVSTLREQRAQYYKVLRHVRQLSKTPRYASKVKLLLTVPGVGLISAMTILTELGDVSRFSNENKLMAYIGLMPRTSSSGDKQRIGGLNKRGNKILRTTLIQCAWTCIRHDSWMAMYLESYISRGKSKNKAIVKIARKLSLIIRSMLIHNKPYEKR